MWRLVALLQVGLGIAFSLTDPAKLARRDITVDRGDFIEICKQYPLEIGIVLDSSSSIRDRDFKAGKKFLQDFLSQYEIGNAPNDVRVSVISYGKGIYPEIGFNLTTYDSEEKVLNATGNIPHKAGLYTDTGKAIRYMHHHQLAGGIVRPGVPKIGIVITDGNSQEWRFTKRAAEDARKDGITMFAIGVGASESIRDDELLNIAGEPRQTTRVDNYNELQSIKENFAYQTCFVERNKTTSHPLEIACGDTDILFVFSPADLGPVGTIWATSLINATVDSEKLATGFKYGVLSGFCQNDEGFNLDEYNNIDDIKRRVFEYKRLHVLNLVQTLASDGFTAVRGARKNASKVAVIVAEGKNFRDLKQEVANLSSKGVQVIVSNTSEIEQTVSHATVLTGTTPKLQAENLVSMLCPSRQIIH